MLARISRATHEREPTMPTVNLPDTDTYVAARRRIIAVAEDLPADRATRPVATCPGWTVHDVVAHLTGIADDVLAGRMAGLGSPGWTAQQVEARRERTIREVCAEWTSLSDAFDALLRAQPPLALAAAADAVVHELDLADALGRPIGGDDPTDPTTTGRSLGIRQAARRYAELSAGRLAEAGLGSITIESTEGDLFVDGGPRATCAVRAPALDLLEVFTGRRTLEQAVELPWTGDAEAVIPHLSPYGPLPVEPVGV
jgi:uncharacterized protein (TIGR03083 family)